MLSKAEAILLWSSNFWALGMGMFGPLYAVFAERIGGNVLEISWVYATYLAVMGVGIVLVGKMADSVGHVRLLMLGRVLGVLATFGYLLVHSIATLLIVQVLIAVSTALREPTWYALYDKYSGDGDHDGYLWGLSSGLWYIFQGAAMLLGGYIVTIYSFDVLFVVMGVVLTISTAYQAKMLRYRVQ